MDVRMYTYTKTPMCMCEPQHVRTNKATYKQPHMQTYTLSLPQSGAEMQYIPATDRLTTPLVYLSLSCHFCPSGGWPTDQ